MRAREHVSPAKATVTATATSAGADGSTATRSSAAPSGAPGMKSDVRSPPATSSAGFRRKRTPGLSMGPVGQSTTYTAFNASSAAATSESCAAKTDSPPSVARLRSIRDGCCARHAAGKRPAVALCAMGESAAAWSVTMAPSRRSPSSISIASRPSAARSRTFATSCACAKRRVPPATGTTPRFTRSSASASRLGR